MQLRIRMLHLVLLCAFLSLFANLFLSASRVPASLVTFVLGFRDLSLIVVALIWPFLINRKSSRTAFFLCGLYSITILFFSLQLVFVKNYAPIINAISLSRIVLALPVLAIIFCVVLRKHNLAGTKVIIEKWVFVFLCMCIAESVLLVAGFHEDFIKFIGFQNFMSGKGVSSGTAFGFFGSRLITPMFNASVGGLILGLIFGYYLQNKRSLHAVITIIPLLLTVSKTGYIVALIFLVFRSRSCLLFLVAGVSYLVLSLVISDLTRIRQLGLPDIMLRHVGSVEYHMNGLVTGLENFVIPVGLGNAGTIVGVVMPEIIGRESGFGVGIATSGIFYLTSFLVASVLFAKTYSKKGATICCAYFMVSLMSEAPSTFYIWVPIMLLFLAPDSHKSFRKI